MRVGEAEIEAYIAKKNSESILKPSASGYAE